MLMDYSVRLTDGSTITITGVASVEKDGAGLRFRDETGGAIASFDDGQAKAHWPANAAVTPVPVPDEGGENGDAED